MDKKQHTTFGIFWEYTQLEEHLGDGVFSCQHVKGAKEISEDTRMQIVRSLVSKEVDTFYDTLLQVMGSDGLESIGLIKLPYGTKENGDICFSFGWGDPVRGALVEEGYVHIRASTRKEIEAVEHIFDATTYT